MTARRVLRYVVPIDEQPHEIAAGLIVLVTPDREQVVTGAQVDRLEVWIEADVLANDQVPAGAAVFAERLTGHLAAASLIPARTTRARVYGTGWLLPDDVAHLASCVDGRRVWHLYDVDSVRQARAAARVDLLAVVGTWEPRGDLESPDIEGRRP